MGSQCLSIYELSSTPPTQHNPILHQNTLKFEWALALAQAVATAEAAKKAAGNGGRRLTAAVIEAPTIKWNYGKDMSATTGRLDQTLPSIINMGHDLSVSPQSIT